MMTTFSLALAIACSSVDQTDASARDLRAELPRDVRIVLLGVPSVKNSRIAAENLRKAVQELDADLTRDGADRNRIDQHSHRVFFRLGQLDNALAGLRQSLRDQERIKGLEDYREFARALELHSETLAGFTGTSDAPLVAEDGDSPISSPVLSSPEELAKQLKYELSRMDDLLNRIEEKAKPDEERKAQLEKDVGALGQFVFQIRNLTEDIRAAEAGQGPVRVDANEIVRGVQGLVDVIRDLKRDRELRSTVVPREAGEPRPHRRARIRP